MLPASFTRNSKATAQRWATPILFGLLLYACIVSFASPSTAYNLATAQRLFPAVAIGLWLAGATGESWRRQPKVTTSLLILILSAVISTASSPNLLAALDRLYLYLATGLLGFLAYILGRRGTRGGATEIFTVIGVVHVLVLAAIVAWIVSMLNGHYDGLTRLPYHSHFRHPGYLGFVAAAGGLGIFMTSRRLRLTAFLLTTCALFEIIALGTRGALYAWLVSAALALCIYQERVSILAFCLATTCIAGYASYYVESHGILAAGSIFARTQEAGAIVIYHTSGRWEMWHDAVRGVLQRPFWGYGPEGYLTSGCCLGNASYPSTAVQPHSCILLWLLEFGIAGIICAANLAIQIVGQLTGHQAKWRSWFCQSSELQALSCCIAGFFTYALVDGLFYHAIPMMLFAVLAGSWCAKIKQLATIG